MAKKAFPTPEIWGSNVRRVVAQEKLVPYLMPM
jgi:hypothetical protein